MLAAATPGGCSRPAMAAIPLHARSSAPADALFGLFVELAIHFRPPAGIAWTGAFRASAAGDRLSEKLARTTGVVSRRCGVLAVPGADPLGERVHLPVLRYGRRWLVADGRRATTLPRVPVGELGNGQNDLRRDPHAVGELVRGGLVRREPEAGCLRVGTATGARARELSDRVGVAAQAPTRDGPPGPGAAVRRRGGR